MKSAELLRVENLVKHFPIRRGLLSREVGRVRAVDGVNLQLKAGETLGLVGESGCGKSTLGRCILHLHKPTAGCVFFEGQDVGNMKKAALKRLRTRMQMVFQDPYASLNPRMRVREIIGEAIRVHGLAANGDWRDQVARLLGEVGLAPDCLGRYPHEFSGGQRQRIGIARALAMNPKLIVADEPVSALDVSVQAQVLNLLERLKAKFGLSYLFIAHDLAVVEHVADRIAVMYLGRVVETARDRDLCLQPRHPYTRALLAAVPRPGPGRRAKRQRALVGDVPSPIDPPSGCRFHTRCPEATAECRRQTPDLTQVAPQHWVACLHCT